MTSPAAKFKPAPEDDPLRAFRDEFEVPTFRQMKATKVAAEIGAHAPPLSSCGCLLRSSSPSLSYASPYFAQLPPTYSSNGWI